VTIHGIKKIVLSLLVIATLSGCGGQVSFEKVDYKGHVRIDKGNVGYCFKVPTTWDIRMKLEGADVVCLAPLENGFRDSIVARSLKATELDEPGKAVQEQIDSLESAVTIVEPWEAFDKPVLVTLEESRFASVPLGQLLYVHQRSDGSGVLIACTTTRSQLADKRDFFADIAEKAKYDLADCSGPGGLPDVFPTPEVTFSPAP